MLKPKATTDYIYNDYTARQALEKMRHNGFTAIPVINRKGGYVNTMSEGDFLWFMLNNEIADTKELEEFSVEQIPKRINVEPVYVSSTIEDLILLSMNQNFVPVIDDRRIFIGIVTRRDILQYCYNTLKKLDEKYGPGEKNQ